MLQDMIMKNHPDMRFLHYEMMTKGIVIKKREDIAFPCPHCWTKYRNKNGLGHMGIEQHPARHALSMTGNARTFEPTCILVCAGCYTDYRAYIQWQPGERTHTYVPEVTTVEVLGRTRYDPF